MKNNQLLTILLVLALIIVSACNSNVVSSVTPEREPSTDISHTTNPVLNSQTSSPSSIPTTQEPYASPTYHTSKPTSSPTMDWSPTKTVSPSVIITNAIFPSKSSSQTPTITTKTTFPLPVQSTIAAPSLETATVVKIIDGDTIDVSIDGRVQRVRYIGIDTPEIAHNSNQVDEPYGQEATTRNSVLVSGKTVRLEKDVSDTDGSRLLRYVYVGDLFVNAELVRLGLAKAAPYPPDTKLAGLFANLENQAKANKVGMFAANFVGTKNSDKFHVPTCTWAKKIKIDDEIWFTSVEDAKSQGYVPCGVCKPK
jgi:micrococcal nuclease